MTCLRIPAKDFSISACFIRWDSGVIAITPINIAFDISTVMSTTITSASSAWIILNINRTLSWAGGLACKLCAKTCNPLMPSGVVPFISSSLNRWPSGEENHFSVPAIRWASYPATTAALMARLKLLGTKTSCMALLNISNRSSSISFL